jgi:hypothetical protein
VHLDAQLRAAKRTPAELSALVDMVEAAVRENVRSLRKSLVAHGDPREVFAALFANGLTFTPGRTPDDRRQVSTI